MGLIDLSIPWPRQPPGGAAQPSQKWLELGLRYASIPGANFRNAVSGVSPTVVGTRPRAVQFGQAVGFGASVGSGASSDRILTGFTAHATQRTYIVRFIRNGNGGTNGGRVFDKLQSGSQVELFYYRNATPFDMSFGRQFTSGTAEWIAGGTGGLNTVLTVGIRYDSSSPSNSPDFFLNGALTTTTRIGSAPTGSALTNADPYVMGNRASDNARVWDGWIGEFLIFDTLLEDGALAQLTADANALWRTQRILVPVVASVGGGAEEYSGGSSAAVDVTAAGAGTATESASGGSSAAVAVTAAGAGTSTEQASGGASAAVSVTASGSGTALEQASGGSSAEVSVTAAGEGVATEDGVEAYSGGSSALVAVTAAGAGTPTEQASGGSSATVQVTATGAGTAVEAASGGSSAVVQVTAAGAGVTTEDGVDAYSGGSSASVAVTTTGAGAALEQASGGSSAAIAITSVAAGIASEQASGGSSALIWVTATGAGTDVAPPAFRVDPRRALYVPLTDLRSVVPRAF